MSLLWSKNAKGECHMRKPYEISKNTEKVLKFLDEARIPLDEQVILLHSCAELVQQVRNMQYVTASSQIMLSSFGKKE